MIDSKMARDISTRAEEESQKKRLKEIEDAIEQAQKKELKEVEDAIEQAANRGEYVVQLDYLLYSENIEILQDLGYKFHLVFNPFTCKVYTRIRW